MNFESASISEIKDLNEADCEGRLMECSKTKLQIYMLGFNNFSHLLQIFITKTIILIKNWGKKKSIVSDKNIKLEL